MSLVPDFYLNEKGQTVFTSAYLLRRGYCCRSGCRHCPYGFTNKTVRIQEIEPEETIPLRHRILRPHEPVEKCRYAGDVVPGAFHLGAFYRTEIVGVASFAPEESALFVGGPQMRLRGMAVLPELRRAGVGMRLIAEAELRLRAEGFKVLWFNARQVAFSFYESLGFDYASEMFEIEGIGPHRVMFKKFEEA